MANAKTTTNADTLKIHLETGVPHTTSQLANVIGGSIEDVYEAKALVADEQMIPNRSLVTLAGGGYEAVSINLPVGKRKHYEHLYRRARARRTALNRDLNLNHYPAQRMAPHDTAVIMGLVKAENDLNSVKAEIEHYRWQLSLLGVTV